MANDFDKSKQPDAGASNAAGAGAPASVSGGGDAPAAPTESDRKPIHVVHDMLARITDLLGNHGALVELLGELESLL